MEARNKFNGEHDDVRAYREFDDVENAVKEVLAVEGDDNGERSGTQ